MSEALGAVSMIGDDVRSALAEGAARKEGHNQPRWLIVGAMGLVAIALVMVMLAVWERSNAAGDLVYERRQTRDVEVAVATILDIKADQQRALGDEAYKQNELAGAKIEEIGKQIGLVNVTVTTGSDGRAGPSGMIRKKYTANISEPHEAASVLTWVLRATEQVKGLELSALELQPAKATSTGTPRWTGQVIFTKWEKKG